MRAYVITFFVALILGLAVGAALGILAFPYVFLADIVAKEEVPETPAGHPERKVLARGTFIHANRAGPACLVSSCLRVGPGWSAIQPLLGAWAAARVSELPRYEPGSSGPTEADALIARDGHG